MTTLADPLTEPPNETRAGTGRTVVASRLLGRLTRVGLAPLAGLVVAMVLIQADGYQPVPTLLAGLDYAVGSVNGLARTVAWALPLYLVTVGITIAFRAGMFTIGAEGQVYVGALTGALAGALVGGLAPPAHQALCVAAAAATAAAVSAGLGWMAAHWKVDVVLASLLSNYILLPACAFVANGPFNDPAAEAPGATPAVLDSARFAVLVPRSQLTAAVLVVAVLCLAAWWLVERSVIGYRWRMVGQAPGFALASGIDVSRAQVLSMAASGALCGAGGALLVLASQGRFTTEIAIGLGWTAVLLSLVARARPALAVCWVSAYAVMQAASRRIEQVAEVPADLALLVICAILLVAAASPGVVAVAKARLAPSHRLGRGGPTERSRRGMA